MEKIKKILDLKYFDIFVKALIGYAIITPFVIAVAYMYSMQMNYELPITWMLIISGITNMFFVVLPNYKEIACTAKEIKFTQALKTTFLMFISGAVVGLSLFALLRSLGLTYSENANETAIGQLENMSKLTTAIYGCLIAPATEEIMFRYGLQNTFKNKKLGKLISILSFSFAHISGFGLAELVSLPQYLVLSWFLTSQYEKTGNLSQNILSHTMYNLMSIVII